MRRVFFLITSFSLLLFIWACGRRSGVSRMLDIDDLKQWIKPEYVINASAINKEVQKQIGKTPNSMYADAYSKKYYNKSNPYVWATRMGISPEADTLLNYLSQTGDLGLSHNAFYADTIGRLLQQLRKHEFTEANANQLTGRLEYLLTRAYLRYACGQRFGYLHPRHLMNNLLVDAPEPGETRTSVIYRQIYDQQSEEVSDSFIHHALEQVRHHRLSAFLAEIQPTDTLFRRMQSEYIRAKQLGDTTRTRLARINMERARWRYPHPTGGRYIWVNLASQELTAVDTQRDTMTTMRVCCGNASHKTPLLHSAIKHVELNPYWVIPQTIVRKEIVPRHVGDSAYYARNNYHAINKETKQVVNPRWLSAADLRSGRYTLRQERGAGNSLGRIIFRFPNNFSVYLHDTNNKGAFQRADRAISHGCVRVERPLDLALFFVDDPTPLYVDRIRMAVGQQPLSEQGKAYQENHPDEKPMKTIGYSSPIPVWLDYWTLYPSPHGTLQSFSDKYGYDKELEKELNRI